MKIWIDDIRSAPREFIHIKTLSELKSLLEKNADAIEIISFDHDLGDGEPDGYQIIKWLAEHHLERWPQMVKVHSANPVGSENIRQYDKFIRRMR